MLYYGEFEWDENNEPKIWDKHRVTAEEVEDCFFNPHVRKRKPHASDRYYLYGKTDGGRYLFVVFQYKGFGIIRPISAREMTRGELTKYEHQI